MNGVTIFRLAIKYCLNELYTVTGIKLSKLWNVILDVYQSCDMSFIKRIIPVNQASLAPYEQPLKLIFYLPVFRVSQKKLDIKAIKARPKKIPVVPVPDRPYFFLPTLLFFQRDWPCDPIFSGWLRAVTLIIEKTMKKIFKKKFISDLMTLIFLRYETGTTGIFLGPIATKYKDHCIQKGLT
jgi:hypothetical protein